MHRTTTPRRLAGALAAAGAVAALATAPAAHADSIAYVKDGDIHLATGDGSRSVQVTTTGGYSSVSQDDAGRMVALHGNKIAHLERDGRVISDILTPVSTASGTTTFQGPLDPQLSPDGRKVSYTYYWQYIGYDPYCNPSTGCYNKRLYQGTGYTDPDRFTEWDEPGFRRQTGWIHASWIDNDTQLLSDPSMKPNEDLVLSSPGLDKDAGFQRWAEHAQAGQMEDGELTRDRTKMAFITGDANDHVWFYNVKTGFFPQYPSTCTSYELNQPVGGRFHDLSWAPDGSRLAFVDGGGVSTIAIPAFGDAAGDCGAPSEDAKLILPGATSPDWGPADVPAAPVAQPAPATPGAGGPAGGKPGAPAAGSGIKAGSGKGGTPAPAPATGSGPAASSGAGAGAGAAAPRLVVSAGRLRAVLKAGLRIRLSGAEAGRVTVVVRWGRTVVARGTATVGADGRGRATLRFTAAGRKRLKAKQAVTLRVSGAGVTRSVKFKR